MTSPAGAAAEGSAAVRAASSTSLLEQAEAHIKELEDLEDFYFKHDRKERFKSLAATATKAVERALAVPGGFVREFHVRALLAKGRAASFVEGQELFSEAHLTKAIKLDPRCARAWAALGELYWNNWLYLKAQECFEYSIELCGKSPASLRSLSMVLRAVGSHAGSNAPTVSQAENFARALEMAKEAVALDARDAQNWETLGNAYMADFFVNPRQSNGMDRALAAYGRAEAAYEKTGRGASPQLHLNRGTAAKYIEDYDLALVSFRKARSIGAANAAAEEHKVVDLLERLACSIGRKNDLKVKHLRELTANLQEGEEQRTLRDLQAGEGSEAAPLTARVVKVVSREQELPVIIVCCDPRGEFFALSLYCAEPSKVAEYVIPMRSQLRIQHPTYRQISVPGPGGKRWSYPAVRVARPGDVTVVGSGSLVGTTVPSVFSAGSERLETEEAGSKFEGKEVDSCEAAQPASSAKAPAPGEQWIEQEDARMKRQAQAKAKSRSKAKARGGRAKDKPGETTLGCREEEDTEREKGVTPPDAEVSLMTEPAQEVAAPAADDGLPGEFSLASPDGCGRTAADQGKDMNSGSPPAPFANIPAAAMGPYKAASDSRAQAERTKELLREAGLTVRHTFIDLCSDTGPSRQRSASEPRMPHQDNRDIDIPLVEVGL